MSDAEILSGELAGGPQPRLLGGDLALDFVNTVSSRGDEPGEEKILSYDELVRWLAYAGGLEADAARVLLRLSKAQPAAAARVLAQALALRETIYHVFLALARGEAAPLTDLSALSVTYREVLGHAALVPIDRAYGWQWNGPSALEHVLWPPARAAVALLAAPDLDRVKECANHASCGWLFLDQSKNASRRWCSMDDCGSRDKMRRQYARRRSPLL